MIEASKNINDIAKEELLERYLALPKNQRELEFPSTMSAAKLTGLSRRTIQFWVEIGAVKAIFVGRKCRVNLSSLKTYLKSRIDGQNFC